MPQLDDLIEKSKKKPFKKKKYRVWNPSGDDIGSKKDEANCKIAVTKKNDGSFVITGLSNDDVLIATQALGVVPDIIE